MVLNKSLAFTAAVVSLATLCAATARADDSAGFYGGASVGLGTVRSYGYANASYFGFQENSVGGKLFVGMRPTVMMGGELDFIDFGNPSSGANYSYLSAKSDSKAAALYFVGYLPLSVTWFDAFLKLGVAYMDQSTTVNFPPACIPGRQCADFFGTFHTNQDTAGVAYGGGAQFKFDRLAVRAEYERISADNGEPNLLSVGVSWMF